MQDPDADIIDEFLILVVSLGVAKVIELFSPPINTNVLLPPIRELCMPFTVQIIEREDEITELN